MFPAFGTAMQRSRNRRVCNPLDPRVPARPDGTFRHGARPAYRAGHCDV